MRACNIALLAGMIAWSPVAMAEQAAIPKGVRPVENVLIRPVPGYTAVCRTSWAVADRLFGGDKTVVAIDRENEQVRLRRLTRSDRGRVIEVLAHFDETGRLRDRPYVRRDGKILDGEHTTLTADAIRSAMIDVVYTGVPVSSGDEIRGSLSLAEIQSLLDEFWESPVRVAHWSEVASVYGAMDHETYGEVLVLFWAVEAILRSRGGPFKLAMRGVAYYDKVSGLDIASHSTVTVDGRGVRVVGKDSTACSYAATPADADAGSPSAVARDKAPPEVATHRVAAGQTITH